MLACQIIFAMRRHVTWYNIDQKPSGDEDGYWTYDQLVDHFDNTNTDTFK